MAADLSITSVKAKAGSLLTLLFVMPFIGLLPGCAAWPWQFGTAAPASQQQSQSMPAPTPPVASIPEPAQHSVFPRNEIMAAYIDRIKRKIRSNMKFAESKKNYETMFRIKLKQDMSIISVKVVRSSGNPSYDAAAMAAIKKSGSYPPLPEGLEFAPFASHKINYKLRDTSTT